MNRVLRFLDMESDSLSCALHRKAGCFRASPELEKWGFG